MILFFSCRCPAHSKAFSTPILTKKCSHDAKPNTDYAFEVRD